ncbi:hypothetical protein WBG78_14225 [Chryseolinea sp. T2]|uniref:hypothetical protein n=1 Tax=Chryseolinea sp. T2 TaxID=3129255 RepID=UPI003077FABB
MFNVLLTSFHVPFVIVTLLLLLLSSVDVSGQQDDVVYLSDESVINVNVLNVSGKSVKLDGQQKQKSLNVDKLLMAFSQTGDYMVFALQNSTSVDFSKDAKPHTVDLLVTMNRTILPAYVISATETEIMYEDANDPVEERSISKDILAAVIYKSGRHELYVGPTQGAEILAAVYTNFLLLKNKPFVKPAAQKQIMSNEVATSPGPAAETTSKAAASVAVTVPVVDATLITKETATGGETVGVNSLKSNTTVDNNGAASETLEPEKTLKESAPVTKNEAEKIKPSSHSSDSIYLEVDGKERSVSRTVYEEAARKKIKSLQAYIANIVDIKTNWVAANEDINRACRLFVSEDVTVEVPAGKDGTKTKVTIRAYLNQLKQLKLGKYSRVEVTLRGFRQGVAPEKGSDGIYTDTLFFEQEVKGIVDEKIVHNSDATRSIKLVLVSDGKSGDSIESVGVMLSDIALIKGAVK